MKRFSDGYNSGGANKRSRMGPDDIELRVLIPSRCAGSIIGKGGANISRLRNDYSAKVTIPDCPGPERILSITATLDQAVNVLGEALPNLEIYGGAGGGRRNRNQPEERIGDNDLRILVHQSQAGCVIGKGGGKIKELREKTGARIKVFAACCPNSTDRVVAINGTDEKCLNSLKEILTLIREQAPIKGEVIPYDPTNFDVYYASEYGGFGGGDVDEMGGGPPVGRRMAPRGYGDGPPPSRGRRGGAGGGGGYGGGGYGAGGYGDYESMGGGVPPVGIGNGGPPAVRETTQVTIPKDLAGAIIGKSGMKIRQVRQESGADITVAEALPGSDDRIITIVGTPREIQTAQYLLQQCVHENMRPGGRY